MKAAVGMADILLVTLDTLRYDVAQEAWREGLLETLAPYLGQTGWEPRHSPASFTYAAHHAFLAGFLPTPLGPGPHPRLWAAEFAGSLSTTPETFVFSQATLPEALSARGYRTICIGGTGFFNQQNALARVLPDLFGEAYWNAELGVTGRTSEIRQVELAVDLLQRPDPVFLFLNVAALHQPNWFYGASTGPDTRTTHKAALVAVDRALARLFQAFEGRPRDCFAVVCSDHGTAYGEDGYFGHRLGHEVVWTVPYLEFWIRS